MKNYKPLLCALLSFAFLTAASSAVSIKHSDIAGTEFIMPISADEYNYKITDPKKFVKSSSVWATVLYDINGFECGDTVEVLRGSNKISYKVSDGSRVRWVSADALDIPEDPETNAEFLTAAQLERYVNEAGFESKTDYFIWIDIDRQRTYIFEGEKGTFKLLHNWECSTGINKAPTVRGNFSVSDRGKWFYSHDYEQGGKYWVRFNGSYLFHSVPFDKTQSTVVDETMNERASHGCVRLSVENSKWIYDNIGRGTAVWSN